MRTNRKDEIFETAIRLFREKGYDHVSVQDICTACDMTKKAFYYHFSAKSEVILQYFYMLHTDFDWERLKKEEQAGAADYPELLWQYEHASIVSGKKLGVDLMKVLYFLSLNQGNNILTPFLAGSHKNPLDQSEYIAMIERGQACGQISKRHSAQEMLEVMFSAVIGIEFHWAISGGGYDYIAEARRIFDFIVRP